MKILNFGSMNIDYVYSVDHMVEAGETLSTGGMEVFSGGKGLNQTIALAKAGAKVYHAGIIGKEGGFLKDAISESGADVSLIREYEGKSGHTIIQVDKNGQNCILLYGGANRSVTGKYVDEVLAHFEEGDVLLLQNEINMLPYIIDCAYARGMNIVLNPSPFNDSLKDCNLNKVSMFLVNEIEGQQITGEKTPERILDEFRKIYPQAEVVLTLGSEGSVYQNKEKRIYQKIYKVKAVDTTAAGDTFTGYFISSVTRGEDPEQALNLAAKASAISVTREGAAPSIPVLEEVINKEL